MQKFTILIIEDEKNIQTFMRKILTKHNYRVLCADNGTQGLNLIRSQCPDVILLDLGLPDMNGNHIITDVRAWSSTPIIVISARSAEKEKVLALDLGADDYITKPFGTSELLARIRTSLRHSNRLQTDSTLYIRPYVHGKMLLDFSKRLLTIDGNEIHLTGKARQLLTLVPEDLKKPELTADWEMKLSRIAKGQMKRDTFMKEIDVYTREIVQEIKADDGVFRHDNLTNHKCPVCGKRMLAVNGKQAKMLVCQDRECGYKETVSRTTNARCPKCHKRMEMYVKGKEETFICTCGYKEKLSAFQARREKEGAGVNKRDVQKYMRQQQKEAKEPVNNAFAQALAGLKLE